MKNKKNILLALIFLFISLIILGISYVTLRPQRSVSSQENNATSSATGKESGKINYMLDGYPIDEVPLYKSISVSSMKYFVNDDPQGYPGYFGKPVNYYNVVFETEASPKELLQYYRSMMSEINEEYVSDEQIQGKIGKYGISASHYGNNPQNYAYLQVYLPAEEYQETNRFSHEYPNAVEIQPDWTEYESSYGLLNQKGGEKEYTQYFTMPEKIDEQIQDYQAKYQNSPEYSFNSENGAMAWKSGEWKIVLTFSKSHGRIYLMMRKPM